MKQRSNCAHFCPVQVSRRASISGQRALESGKLVRVTVPNRAREGGTIAPGARVYLAWSAGDALMLDA